MYIQLQCKGFRIEALKHNVIALKNHQTTPPKIVEKLIYLWKFTQFCDAVTFLVNVERLRNPIVKILKQTCHE